MSLDDDNMFLKTGEQEIFLANFFMQIENIFLDFKKKNFDEMEKRIIFATKFNCTVAFNSNGEDFYISSHFYDYLKTEIRENQYKYFNSQNLLNLVNIFLKNHGKKNCNICEKNYSDMKCSYCNASFCYDCFIKHHYKNNVCSECNKNLDNIFDYFNENQKKLKHVL